MVSNLTMAHLEIEFLHRYQIASEHGQARSGSGGNVAIVF